MARLHPLSSLSLLLPPPGVRRASATRRARKALTSSPGTRDRRVLPPLFSLPPAPSPGSAARKRYSSGAKGSDELHAPGRVGSRWHPKALQQSLSCGLANAISSATDAPHARTAAPRRGRRRAPCNCAGPPPTTPRGATAGLTPSIMLHTLPSSPASCRCVRSWNPIWPGCAHQPDAPHRWTPAVARGSKN